jgi:hypothetical protein
LLSLRRLLNALRGNLRQKIPSTPIATKCIRDFVLKKNYTAVNLKGDPNNHASRAASSDRFQNLAPRNTWDYFDKQAQSRAKFCFNRFFALAEEHINTCLTSFLASASMRVELKLLDGRNASSISWISIKLLTIRAEKWSSPKPEPSLLNFGVPSPSGQ